MQTVAEFITQKRNEAGLTKQDLATALKTHWDTINKWEKGDRTPRGAKLIAIRGALGIKNLEPIVLAGHDGEEVVIPPVSMDKEPMALAMIKLITRVDDLEKRLFILEGGKK